eukprot:5759611-Alexandrium_andersonii.AAC.1
MDYELFLCHFATARGWSNERSHAEWKRLEALPESKCGRDNFGPEHSRLRLHVPANLVGSGKVHRRK